jgi:hypothetical protein
MNILSEIGKNSKVEKRKNFNPSVSEVTDELRPLLRRAFLTAPSGKSPEQIAEALGVSPGYLYNSLNPNHTFRFSLNKIFHFCRSTGDDSFLSWLSKKLGYQTVKLPEAVTTVNYVNAVNDCLIALAEAQKALNEALYLNGSDHERELAIRLDWLIAGAVRLREVLKKKKKGGR